MPLVRTVRAIAVLAAALTGVLSGCGISADRSPHVVDADQRKPLIEEVSTAGAPRPGTSARIYFLSSSEQGRSTRLQAVGRDVAQSATAQVLAALFDGLTGEEQRARLRTAIPPGTRLLSAQLADEKTLEVDVSSEFFGVSGEVLTDAVAQIVFTASRVNNEYTVRLTVEGEEQEWPIGDGSLVSRPLSTFDYPNRTASSQPDYPALPSVTATTISSSSAAETPPTTTTTVAPSAR